MTCRLSELTDDQINDHTVTGFLFRYGRTSERRSSAAPRRGGLCLCPAECPRLWQTIIRWDAADGNCADPCGSIKTLSWCWCHQTLISCHVTKVTMSWTQSETKDQHGKGYFLSVWWRRLRKHPWVRTNVNSNQAWCLSEAAERHTRHRVPTVRENLESHRISKNPWMFWTLVVVKSFGGESSMWCNNTAD